MEEHDLMIQVEILKNAIYITFFTNSLAKGMITSFVFPAIGKIGQSNISNLLRASGRFRIYIYIYHHSHVMPLSCHSSLSSIALGSWHATSHISIQLF